MSSLRSTPPVPGSPPTPSGLDRADTCRLRSRSPLQRIHQISCHPGYNLLPDEGQCHSHSRPHSAWPEARRWLWPDRDHLWRWPYGGHGCRLLHDHHSPVGTGDHTGLTPGAPLLVNGGQVSQQANSASGADGDAIPTASTLVCLYDYHLHHPLSATLAVSERGVSPGFVYTDL